MKPLIGITSYRHVFPTRSTGPNLLGSVLSDDYAHGVETAGGLPVILPFAERKASISEYADVLDGLLLSGGDDVTPELYGEEPRVGLGEVSPERDELEIALISAMVDRGKPILGICRGIQILNVAFGGSLYQDLNREWRGSIQHSQKARRSHLSHTVHIQPASRLYELLGGRPQVRCNSFHHQAIRNVGNPLIPVAWDEEGLVEGVEHPELPFVVGVQWHPENLWRTESGFLGLFRGLVESAMVNVEP